MTYNNIEGCPKHSACQGLFSVQMLPGGTSLVLDGSQFTPGPCLRSAWVECARREAPRVSRFTVAQGQEFWRRPLVFLKEQISHGSQKSLLQKLIPPQLHCSHGWSLLNPIRLFLHVMCVCVCVRATWGLNSGIQFGLRGALLYLCCLCK